MTWLALALLGAYHGLNPAMGWLFAVSMGLQEGRTTAVLRALPPIAIGHAASVAIVVAIVAGAQLVVPLVVLRVAAATIILAFVAFLLVRRFAHPRWVGMRLGFRDLILWSFLMSSAHGAALMLLPVLFELTPEVAGSHAAHLRIEGSWAAGASALGVHTAAMFLAMTVVAVIVFRMIGLEVLRRAWINLDFIWAGALTVAAIFTLVAI